MATGLVVGGHFLGAPVSPIMGSTLVVQAGLKWRKLTAEQVNQWSEVPTDSNGNPISAVGKAVVGVVAPRMLSRTASAAVGAALDSTIKPSHRVRVEWADEKVSLIKLPDSLFQHFAVMLEGCRAAEPELVSQELAIAPPAPVTPPTVAEQAFSLVSGIVKDRFPGAAKAVPDAAPAPDITSQLTSLAALRDQGILTEDEFAAKKADLLSRL